MELFNFKCGECDETHYHISVSTEECVSVTRQEVTIELDRNGMEYLMEEIQRQLIQTPVSV
jgi:hypothetical protein